MTLKIAILGTRGIPASYGGFETFAEELATRLVARGHEVTVYARSHHTPRSVRQHRGVRVVVLPTIRHKYLDTVCHTFLSSIHALGSGYDVALYCNAANAMFLPLPRLRGTRTAINVDGLEWKRKKWNWLGKLFYRLSERLSCRLGNALITDAKVIQAYYRDAHHAESEFIPYGAPTEKASTDEALRRFGLDRGKYFLYVSRLEPENNADRVVEAFVRLDTDLRLAVVGDAPYAREYIEKLRGCTDPRVVFTGYVFGRGYAELMSHAFCYVHATEVGGIHPALLEAMGLGNGILANDVPENREAAGDGAVYFSFAEAGDLTSKMAFALREPDALRSAAVAARELARLRYDWDAVANRYEALCLRLASHKAPSRLSTEPPRLPEASPSDRVVEYREISSAP